MDRDVRVLAEKTLPILLDSREKYRILAREAYTAALKAAYPDAEPVGVPDLRELTLDSWEGSLKKALMVTQNEKILPVSERAAKSALVKADRHARNAERDHAVAYSIDDKRSIGWARYDPIPGTCAWCLLQISRGPVFRSKISASKNAVGEKWHDGCTCEAVQVFKGKPWRGEELYKEMDALYKDQEGKNSREKVKNFREAVKNRRVNKTVGSQADKIIQSQEQ